MGRHQQNDCEHKEESTRLIQTTGKTTAVECSKETERLSDIRRLWILTRFSLPLIFALTVPSLSEQLLARGITTVAKDGMTQPLASYGLAYYLVRLFTTVAVELRHVGVAFVYSREANRTMTKLSFIIGIVLSGSLLVMGLTPASDWLIRVVHRQSSEVTKMTVTVMLYLSPLPLLEAMASYYEGVLIHQKLTSLTGLARLAESGIQVGIVLVFIFTPLHNHIQPILVPVIAMCSAYCLRLTLVLTFWFVAAKHKLPEETHSHQDECDKELSMRGALLFWMPLVFVRFIQVVSLPLVSLVVSRAVAMRDGEQTAAKSAAVLTIIYPLASLLHTFLNDLRAAVPVFRQKTETHDPFTFKILGLFSGLFILLAFILNVILLMTPQVTYFILHTIMGLNEELSSLCLIPLRIYCLKTLAVGVRAYCTGILITWKKTAYLTPGSVVSTLGLIIGLILLPYTRIRGDVMGVICLLFTFLLEMSCAILAVLWLHFRGNKAQQ